MINSVLITLMGAFLTVAAQAADGASSDHHSHHGAPAKSEAAKPTKKFAADENLKPRMAAILDAVRSLEKVPGKERPQAIKASGEKIEGTVQDIFKNCKLEPEADQAIHPILANILDGAKLLKSGQEKPGHNKIHKALLNYQEAFDHPGWKNLK